MSHLIEAAPSGRAKCRGCRLAIAKGELRLGERLPNPFSDDKEMTLWFHLVCGAYKRPEVLLEALSQFPDTPGAGELRALAEPGLAHHRLPRVDGLERASSARARCRHCREPIVKDALRIRLVYYEEGSFQPSGFVHAACAGAYFGTTDLIERAVHFSGKQDESLRTELAQVLSAEAT